MAESRFDTLLALHRSGRVEEAEAGYRERLRAGDAKAGAALGILLLQQGRYGEAGAVLEPLAVAAPDNPDLAVNLSVALRHDGRLSDALQAARRARERAPENVAACNALGLAALELEKIEEALDAFEAGLRIAPNQSALELHRGHCLRRLGRNTESLRVFEQVTQSAPQLLDAWRARAAAEAVLGHTDAALTSRDRAFGLAPQNPEVGLELAVALLHAGRQEEAIHRLTALAHDDSDARALTWLGKAYLKRNDAAAALSAFERAAAADPDDASVAHQLAALRGELPERVESDYIRTLFDEFADHFEHTLVHRLDYSTPRSMADFIRREIGDGAACVLDLGCGTGLVGAELARPGRFIDGVDLSPRMLAAARAKNVYRELHEAEIVGFLESSARYWDWIVAADVFIYIAELRPVFRAVAARLNPGGCFAFSIEASASGDTELPAASGRYRHASARVDAELAQAGFGDTVHEPVVLRLEGGAPVPGELVLARCPTMVDA